MKSCIEVYGYTGGDYIGEYKANIVPRVGEEMFFGDAYFKVVNVSHIVLPCKAVEDVFHFDSVQIEVEEVV